MRVALKAITLFRTAFQKIPEKAPKLPLIGAIDFSTLRDAKETITGRPISCQCGAVLISTSQVSKDPNLGLVFTCRYCHTLNVVNPADLKRYPDYPTTDLDFVIEEQHPDQHTRVSGGRKGEKMAAIIDISGSMDGGKLEAVKHSLIDTINDLKTNSPTTDFLLLTFATNVNVHAIDGSSIVMPQAIEHDEEKIGQWFSRHKPLFKPLGQYGDEWARIVGGLATHDYTALGPALLGGVNLLLDEGGRIILLTDGLANQGIGKLEGVSTSGKAFYQHVARTTKQTNIIVDVVGVSNSDSSNLALQVLGELAVESGGDIYYVSAEEVRRAFETMRDIKYI